MSTLIAVDPNVLLGVTLGDRHCIWAIEELSERAAELCLALDERNQIFSEYDTLAGHLLANGVTKTFIEKFLNARNRRQRINSAVLNDDERHWLATEPKSHGTGRTRANRRGQSIARTPDSCCRWEGGSDRVGYS